MKLYPICASCNLGSMAKLMEIVEVEGDPWEVMRHLMKVASQVPGDLKPVELYKILYDQLMEGKVVDIYKEEKRQMNEAVLSIYPWLQSLVKEAENPVKRAIRLSIIGNIIDLGVHGHRWGDLKEEVLKSLKMPLYYDERDTFIDMLGSAKTLFIIGDNAGEVVFDRLLIETLQEHYPHLEIKYGVRGEPLLNDITEEDAIHAGIGKGYIVNTGVDLPGFVPSRANEEALKVIKEADIIISKGQGNFEGLSESPFNIFFALRAKCQPVASEWKAPIGSLIFSRVR